MTNNLFMYVNSLRFEILLIITGISRFFVD